MNCERRVKERWAFWHKLSHNDPPASTQPAIQPAIQRDTVSQCQVSNQGLSSPFHRRSIIWMQSSYVWRWRWRRNCCSHFRLTPHCSGARMTECSMSKSQASGAIKYANSVLHEVEKSECNSSNPSNLSSDLEAQEYNESECYFRTNALKDKASVLWVPGLQLLARATVNFEASSSTFGFPEHCEATFLTLQLSKTTIYWESHKIDLFHGT